VRCRACSRYAVLDRTCMWRLFVMWRQCQDNDFYTGAVGF